MVRKKRYPIIVLSCLLLALSLSGCAKPAPNEKKIAADLQASESFQGNFDVPGGSSVEWSQGLQIYETTIIKRQTDDQAKRDQVYVQVSAKNDNEDCTLEYLMTYNLYNDGWALDDVEPYEYEKWTFTPLRGVLENDIIEQCPSGEIVSNEVNLAEGSHSIRQVCTEEHPCGTVTRTENTLFSFRDGEWWLEATITDESETVVDWHINGKWETHSRIFSMCAIEGNVFEVSFYNRHGELVVSALFTARPTTDLVAETGLSFAASSLGYEINYVSDDMESSRTAAMWKEKYPYVIDLGRDVWIYPLCSADDAGAYRGIIDSNYYDTVGKIYLAYDSFAYRSDTLRTAQNQLNVVMTTIAFDDTLPS